MPKLADPRIAFDCPACGAMNDVPQAFAGKRGKCSSCKEVVRVPTVEEDRRRAPEPLPLTKRDLLRIATELLDQEHSPNEAFDALHALGVDRKRARETLEQILGRRHDKAVVQTAGGIALVVVGIVVSKLLSSGGNLVLFQGLIVFGGLTLAAGLNTLTRGAKLDR